MEIFVMGVMLGVCYKVEELDWMSSRIDLFMVKRVWPLYCEGLGFETLREVVVCDVRAK